MERRLFLVALVGLAACEPGLTPSDSVHVALAGGSFAMGSSAPCADSRGTACAGDRVAHPVKVSAFVLDATEVSQLQYAACAQNGACPVQFTFDADHKDEPALVDDPAAARAYCAAKGMRLPTEAEFEFAARVAPDGSVHRYPWGDVDPGCDRLAFAGCGVNRPPAVGTNPGDVTASGIHDLAGSVPEWVEDTYVATAGCFDRLGYGELCWGKTGGCVTSRCAVDGASCAKGCLPPSEDVASAATGGSIASTPVCPALPVAMAATTADPVVKSPTGLQVVRGGSFSDGRCALAGYTRRHAEPRRFAAGFRCARETDPKTAPTAPSSYRFSLGSCPTGASAKVTITGATGPAAYRLDVFPSGGAPMTTAMATAGVVDQLPCSAVFVARPTTTGPMNLTVHVTSTPALCVPDSPSAFDLSTSGGDLPAVGADELSVNPATTCG